MSDEQETSSEQTASEKIALHQRAALIRRAQEKVKAGKPLTKAELKAIEEVDADKKRKGNDGRYRTYADIANEYGVAQRTVARWATQTGFPPRSPDGWLQSAIDQFVADNALGAGPTEHKVNGVSLTEANIRKILEQTENERIEKEIALAEQAKLLGRLVDAEEVRAFYVQTQATIAAQLDSLVDAVDRAMPEMAPPAEAWADVRERVIGICQRLGADVSTAMKVLG